MWSSCPSKAELHPWVWCLEPCESPGLLIFPKTPFPLRETTVLESQGNLTGISPTTAAYAHQGHTGGDPFQQLTHLAGTRLTFHTSKPQATSWNFLEWLDQSITCAWAGSFPDRFHAGCICLPWVADQSLIFQSPGAVGS